MVTEYHGTEVAEDYRWLEHAADPEVIDWTRQQNAFSREILDASPNRAAIERRLAALHSQTGRTYGDVKAAGNRLFAIKHQPPLEQPLLVTLRSLDDLGTERTIVDPTAVEVSGTVSIESYFPSPDGRLVAVILAQGGSEQGTLHLFEVDSGRRLGDIIERVAFPTGGGSIAWERDSTGFYYTRYPRSGERPEKDLPFYEQVYHHRVGTSDSIDQFIIGWEFPRIAEVFLATSRDREELLVTVQKGDGGDFAHWLRGSDGNIRRIADFPDGLKPGLFGPDGFLYFVSKKDAPRGKIVRIPAHAPTEERQTLVVPEGAATVDGYSWRGLEIVPNFAVTLSGIFVTEIDGGPSQVRVFDLEGKFKHKAHLPAVSAVDQLTSLPNNEVLYRVGTFLQPHTWYRQDLAEPSGKPTVLSESEDPEMREFEVVRETAKSKDGTQVPISVIRKRGLRLHCENALLLTGYGGYGVNLVPTPVSAKVKIWLQSGGVYAVANLRGGGEFGDDWHKAGRLTKKQNVFDDFTACAQHLVQRKYTRPSRLAIEGGSNGGLLMGASLTQNPHQFRAVVSHVGIYDMLRVELDANGTFNVPEFGSVADIVQFQALLSYSPYHNVKNGTRYPAVLFLTGENDGRVNPSHSRKMTARLQSATTSRRPVLLRTSGSSGHGHGTALSERISQEADVLTFLFDQVNLPFRTPASGKK
ncbi:MAG: S9 family peptidase [Verrucomicrobiales bacterium]|nr:S9 family peptidase [Verrucomicrobiales bacterium]